MSSMSENNAPISSFSNRAGAWSRRGSKPKEKVSTRRALGDISNRLRTTHGNKDKVTKPSSQTSRSQRSRKQVENKRVSSNGDRKQPVLRPSSSAADQRPRRRSSVCIKSEEPVTFSQISMVLDSPNQTEDEVYEKEDDTQAFLASIDVDEKGNQLAFSEYVNDVYAYMRTTESQWQASSGYMSRQRDINQRMREILIDWLVEVHLKFRLEQETLFLTVNLIDRFLERRAVTRTKLQLVGCAAMLLASKYEEIYAPEVRDFVYISDRAYTREQILAMETIILNALDFNLTISSSLKFAERFIKVVKKQRDDRFINFVHYLIELTLQDFQFMNFVPSMIACSAIFIALRVYSPTGEVWPTTIARYSQYTPAMMQPCLSALWSVLNVENPKYKAVRKKYSSSKLSSASLENIDHAYCEWLAPASQSRVRSGSSRDKL